MITAPMFLLLSCGPRERIKWDSLAADDQDDDFVSALVLQNEADRDEIVGPHVVGGTLRMRAVSRSSSAIAWRLELLEPDIVDIVEATPDGNGMTIELAFLREGNTDLFIVDGDGAVLDVQSLSVRQPIDAELVLWEWVQTGEATAVGNPEFHTVQGAAAQMAVTWIDRAGQRLAGGQLLSVDATPPAGVKLRTGFTGEFDTVDLIIGDDAPLVSVPFTLLAGDTPSGSYRAVIHADDEAAGLEFITLERPDGGALRVAVLTSRAEELLGAPITFRWGVDEAVGTVLLFEAGEPIEVEACFMSPTPLCATTQVPGTPTGVADRQAPAECSCASTRGGGWLGALLLLPWIRRRQISPSAPAR